MKRCNTYAYGRDSLALIDIAAAFATAGGCARACVASAITSCLYNCTRRWWIKDQATHTGSYRTVRGETTQCTAAPEGGARTPSWEWVRGCIIAMCFATSATAQDVPSGQAVTLNEVLVDRVDQEAWVRFRFLTPEIARGAGAITYEQAQDDLAALCEAVARPYLVEYALGADVVVISLMDRAVPFGVSDPEATQFFETFRIQDDACVWQAF